MKKKIYFIVSILFFSSFCSKSKEFVYFDFLEKIPQARISTANWDASLFSLWQTNDRMYGWGKSKKYEKDAIIVPKHKDKAVFRFGSVTQKNQKIILNLKSLIIQQPVIPPILNIYLNGNHIFSSSFNWTEFQEISLPAKKEFFCIGENFLEFLCEPFPEQNENKHWLALRDLKFEDESPIFYPALLSEQQQARIVTQKTRFSEKKALKLLPDTILSYNLKIPEQAKLVFDFYFEPSLNNPDKEKRFLAALGTASGKNHILFERVFGLKSKKKKDSLSIDLTPYQGQICQFSFVFSNDSQNEASTAKIFITKPRIITINNPVESSTDIETGYSLQKPFNILIYLVDCLRPDHLPFYGYKKNTAPHMTEFVKDCVLFKNSYAQSSWTRTSVGAIFTGLYPFQHMAINFKSGLAADLTTMAEFLKKAGYNTIGISANAGIKQFFNFDQGFSYFKYHYYVGGGTAETLNTYAFSQLQMKKRPFFLYIHTMEPHRPYQLKEEFNPVLTEEDLAKNRRIINHQKRGEVDLYSLISYYDASISQNDKSFGDLIAELKKLDLYDETLIILMSDHGEEFNEHGGFAHGRTLYQETVKNVLAVKLPQQINARTEIQKNVQ